VERIAEPIGVVAAVADQPLGLRPVVEQRRRAGVVADLAGRHEEAYRSAVRIGQGMQLCVQPALGAPDQPAKTPFSSRRPAAVRCALGVGGVDHDGLRLGTCGRQAFHHAGEHAGSTPALLLIVQRPLDEARDRLGRPVGARRTAPAQAVPDEHDAAEHPPIVHLRLAVPLGKRTAAAAPPARPRGGTGRSSGLLTDPEPDRRPHTTGS